MPYTHQEDFGGALQDRQISILTTANIAGAFLGAIAMWQLLSLLGLHLHWLLHYGLIVIVGSGSGIGLTIRWEGISLLDTIILWTGWRVRVLMQQTTIHPQAALASLDDGEALSLYDGDDVLVRPYDPHAVQEAAPYGS